MALSVKQQFQYWSIGFVVVLLIFYFLGSALTPFIVGAGLAYCLDPLADRLETLGASRVLATVIITVIALLAFLLVVIILVPFLAGQARALVETVPGMIETLRQYLASKFPDGFEEGSALRDALNTIQQRLSDSGGTLLNSVLQSTLAVFDFLLLLVVAPVVAFYLLLDWDNMIAKIDSWLPLDHRDTVRTLAREVDGVLNSFLRGQLTVMLFLGSFYALGLMLIGLEFGAFVGLFAGLISFIPYVGSILGGAIAFGLAISQFWGEWQWIDPT